MIPRAERFSRLDKIVCTSTNGAKRSLGEEETLKLDDTESESFNFPFHSPVFAARYLKASVTDLTRVAATKNRPDRIALVASPRDMLTTA